MAQHDDDEVDEFDEYVEDRPEPARGSQRLLIIILSVGCLALAVSNVVLAMRVTQLRRALVAERPAVAPAPAADRSAETVTPPIPKAPVPPAPKAEVVAAPAPELPNLDLPPRSTPRQARVAAVTRTTDRPATAPSSPERSTAAWMVQEYGRTDAESRARAVAEFYGAHSHDGAYWRRVLAEISATRR